MSVSWPQLSFLFSFFPTHVMSEAPFCFFLRPGGFCCCCCCCVLHIFLYCGLQSKATINSWFVCVAALFTGCSCGRVNSQFSSFFGCSFNRYSGPCRAQPDWISCFWCVSLMTHELPKFASLFQRLSYLAHGTFQQIVCLLQLPQTRFYLPSFFFFCCFL